MKRIKLEGWLHTINKAITEAKQKANDDNCEVEFDFNGINVVVNKDTIDDYLLRDYFNAHLMDWKEIGPNPLVEYDKDTLAAIELATEKQRIESEEQKRIWKEQEKLKLEAFNKQVEGIEVEFSNREEFDKGIAAQNGQDYGLACFRYAENWAKLMQKRMSEGKTLEEVAQQASFDADLEGITGFMYGAAVSILAASWKYGEQLKKWHNKKYNQEDAENIVNPAVITIKTKD